MNTYVLLTTTYNDIILHGATLLYTNLLYSYSITRIGIPV